MILPTFLSSGRLFIPNPLTQRNTPQNTHYIMVLIIACNKSSRLVQRYSSLSNRPRLSTSNSLHEISHSSVWPLHSVRTGSIASLESRHTNWGYGVRPSLPPSSVQVHLKTSCGHSAPRHSVLPYHSMLDNIIRWSASLNKTWSNQFSNFLT